MAANGKSLFSHNSKQDYMNILYSDSDSDKVPDLKLPSIKGKRQKRKKGTSMKHDDSMCTAVTILKCSLGFIVFALIGCLTILSIWNYRTIRALQDDIVSLQNSDKSALEILKLQTQLTQINSSVMQLKTGSGSLEEITLKINAMKSELDNLQNTTSKMQASVVAAKSIMDLPNKVQVATTELASLEIQIGELQTAQRSMLQAVEQRVTLLETHPKEDSMATTNVDVSADKQLGELRQELSSQNQTLNTHLQVMKQQVDKIEGRVTTLEDFTSSKSNSPISSVNRTDVSAIVSEVIQEKIANLTNNVAMLQEWSQQSEQSMEGQVEKSMFLAFKEDMIENFEQLNATVLQLNSEFDTLAQRFDIIEQSVINITAAITEVKEHTSQLKAPDLSLQTKSTEASKSTVASHIHIEGIETREELQNAFENGTWPLDNNELDLKVLKDTLLKNADLGLLKSFDKDKNGHFSEVEMAEALGLSQDPRFIWKQLLDDSKCVRTSVQELA